MVHSTPDEYTYRQMNDDDGHDYVHDGEIVNQADGSLIGLFGVKQAVTEFAEQYGWEVHVTHAENWPSWFAFKK